MQHTVTRPSPPFVALGGAATIHQVPAWTDNLIWLLVCNETGATAAVDGPEAGAALAYCEAHGLRLTTLFNTHTHPDHIGINQDLERRGLLDGIHVVGPAKVGGSVPGLDEPVSDGDTVTLGALEGRVMLTEGHIDGHVSYVFGDVLFCGDTLFTGGCGYLFDGPPGAMFDSLMRLACLPPETRVCCAHEYTQDNLRFAYSVEPDNPALVARIQRVWTARADGGCVVPSTIAEERATNPFLRPGSPTLIERVRPSRPGLDVSDPAAVFAATRALKDTRAYKTDLPDDALPLAQ